MNDILFVSDTHSPYYDEDNFKILLKLAKEWQPDDIVIQGDFIDCYSVSAHEKDPERLTGLAYEILITNNLLDKLDALNPKGRKIYLMGNHEHRLPRFLQRQADALAGVVSLPALLELKQRGWEVVPYMAHTKIGKLFLTHECGNAGPQAHIKAMKTFNGNVVIGHTHRMGIHIEGNARGEHHVGAMFGWLGDLELIDYMHKVQSSQWTPGFGVGEMDKKGNVQLTGLPIIDRGVSFHGKRVGL